MTLFRCASLENEHFAGWKIVALALAVRSAFAELVIAAVLSWFLRRSELFVDILEGFLRFKSLLLFYAS